MELLFYSKLFALTVRKFIKKRKCNENIVLFKTVFFACGLLFKLFIELNS